MKRDAAPRYEHEHLRLGAWILLALMVLITVIVWRHEAAQLDVLRLERVQGQIQEVKTNIARRIEAYLDALRATRGLFTASKSVERGEWRSFVQAMKLTERYPGVRLLGFVRFVPGPEKAAFVASVRADTTVTPGGYPKFDVRPPGERPEYFVIDFMEPFDPGSDLFGFDRGTEAPARAAFDLARDMDLPVATGDLTPGEDDAIEFLLVLPIYRHGLPTGSVQERRAALEGFVSQLFNARDLFEAMLGGWGSSYQFEVRDRTEPGAPPLLYSNDEPQPVEPAGASGTLAADASLRVAGRTWSLRLVPHSRHILGFEENVPLLLLLGGLVISLLAFGFTWSMTTSQARALRTATRITDELREHMEVKETIIDRAPDAVVAIDSDGRILDWNYQAEAIFGWPRAEVMGQRLSRTLIPERFREAHAKGLKRFLETGEGPILNQRIEIVACHRHGNEFPVELTVTPVARNGAYIFSAFVRDISNRKILEGDLRRSLAEARAAAGAMSGFLGTMSQEMLAVARAMEGTADKLSGTGLGPAQRGPVEAVRSCASSLLASANDALDFSRIEAGKLEFGVADVNLRFLVKEAAAVLAEAAQARGLDVGALVEAGVPAILRGDSGRLRQAIVSLLKCVIERTPGGRVVLRVSVAEQKAEDVLLWIEVEGTGVETEGGAQPRQEPPSDPGASSLENHEGKLGLGILITTRLAELMGGCLTARQRPGGYLSLSLTARLGKTAPPAGEPPPPPCPAMDLGSLRVLVVDGDAAHRAVLAHYLSGWGMRSTEADSGSQALEVLRAGSRSGPPVDLAIIDAEADGPDGLGLARAIRSDPALASLPIVLLAPGGLDLPESSWREAGVSACLTKPVRLSQLHECLVLVLVSRHPSNPSAVLPLRTRRLLDEARARNQAETP